MIEEVLEFYAMQYLYEFEQVLDIMICDRGSPRVSCNAIFTRHRASAQNYICDRGSPRDLCNAIFI